MILKLYTDLDSIFDTRRGIIHKLAVENGNTNFDWDRDYKEVYERRKMDHFHQPELGFTSEQFKERFARRSADDFSDENNVYFLPSFLIRTMFTHVRDQEFGVGQVIAASEFNLTINTFPYILNKDEEEVLKKEIKESVLFPINVGICCIDYDNQTQNYFGYFNYVFKYDFLCGGFNKKYWDNYLTAAPITTRFFVPDVLTKELHPDMAAVDDASTIINKINLFQAGKITLIPLPKCNFEVR